MVPHHSCVLALLIRPVVTHYDTVSLGQGMAGSLGMAKIVAVTADQHDAFAVSGVPYQNLLRSIGAHLDEQAADRTTGDSGFQAVCGHHRPYRRASDWT